MFKKPTPNPKPRPKISRGKLKFKPKFQQKLKLQEKILHQKLEKLNQRSQKSTSEIPRSTSPPKKQLLTFPPKPGSGRILTSSTTVMGQDTNFLTEVERNDEIIVLIDPLNFKKEARAVSMIMGDKSLSLKEPFSKNLISYTQFEIKKCDKIVDGEKTVDQKYREKFENFGRRKEDDKHFVEVREKSGMWGYKTKKVEVGRELSREEMLDVRVKNKNLRF